MEIGFFEQAEISFWCGEETLRNRLTGEIYILVGIIWGF